MIRYAHLYIVLLVLCVAQQGLAQCPRITAISTNATDCAADDASFILNPTIFPIDPGNNTYSWTGPNNYTSFDAVAMLPNDNSQDNGTYTLVVTDSTGCSSDPVDFILSVFDRPLRPSVSGEAELCEGEPLILDVTNGANYNGLNVQYQWTTPFGEVTTLIPQLSFTSTTTDFSFEYYVRILLNGVCLSEPSTKYEVIVNSIPAQPNILPIDPVCEGSSFSLATNITTNTQYQWIGPNGLDTIASSLSFPNAVQSQQGNYQVRAIRNVCFSEYSNLLMLEVVSTPTVPIVDNDGPICLGNTGDILNLSIDNNTYNSSYEYIWIDSIAGDTLAGPTNSQSTAMVDFSNYTNGVFDFSAFAKYKGCPSDTSLATRVQINSRGDLAKAGADIRICDVNSISLSANEPTQGTGQWQQTNGTAVNIIDGDEANSKIENLTTGESYQFSWTLSNGVCGAYSIDTVNVTIGSSSQVAMAMDSVAVCDSSSINLQATPAQMGVIGTWTQSTDQQSQGVTIVQSNNALTQVTGLQQGKQYLFNWSLSNEECGTFSNASTWLSIDDSREVAFAGDDQNICGDPSTILMADDALGQWTSNDPNLDVRNTDMPITEVDGLQVGENKLIWTSQNGTCGSSSDEVIIRYEEAVQANNDETELKFSESVEINVLDNDEVSNNVVLIVSTLPSRGRVTMENNTFIYTPDDGYRGTDEFVYEICNATCPDNCDLGVVKIKVDNLFSCRVPTIFTPNNDGVNDAFKILCLEDGGPYGNNSVRIYNQWGDEVFSAAPYGNDWQGTFNGENLPSGTYYYVVDFGDGEVPKSGFVMLER